MSHESHKNNAPRFAVEMRAEQKTNASEGRNAVLAATILLPDTFYHILADIDKYLSVSV